MHDVTQILSQIESGDPSAAEQLLPLIYEDLRRLAKARMVKERADHTLQSTALVHEAEGFRGHPSCYCIHILLFVELAPQLHHSLFLLSLAGEFLMARQNRRDIFDPNEVGAFHAV